MFLCSESAGSSPSIAADSSGSDAAISCGPMMLVSSGVKADSSCSKAYHVVRAGLSLALRNCCAFDIIFVARNSVHFVSKEIFYFCETPARRKGSGERGTSRGCSSINPMLTSL